jgi:DNA repair exonuclease SbcCD ATPase subunit
LKFDSLILKGFGIFDESLPLADRSFKFTHYVINVILGQNERGKTTLMEALLDTLYGIPAPRKDLRKPWITPHAFAAVLEFQVGGKAYRVERDFTKEHAVLTSLTPGGSRVIFSGSASPRGRGGQSQNYRETLEKLGIPSRDVMEQLSFVRKLELETGVSQEIRRLVTGGGRINYHQAISQVIGEYFKLTRINPWQQFNKNKPREIELAQEHLARLEEQSARIREAGLEIIRVEQEMKGLEEDIARIKSDVEDCRFQGEGIREAISINEKVTAGNERLGSLIRERDRIKAKWAKLKEIRQEMEPLSGAFESFTGSVSGLSRELSQARDKMREMEEQESARQVKIQAIQKEKEAIEKQVYDRFPELTIFPSDFPERLRRFHRLETEFRQGIDFYNEKLLSIQDMEKSTNGSDRLSGQLEDFEERLELLRDSQKKAAIEIEFLEKSLQERQSLEEEIAASLNAAEENFPGMSLLPPDLPERIRDHRAAASIAELKKKQLESLKEDRSKLKNEMEKPVNVIPIILGFLLGLAGGVIFKNMALSIFLSFAGLVAGAAVSWVKISSLKSHRDQVESRIKALQDDTAKPLPDLGIPFGFAGRDNLDALQEKLREYQAACRNEERLRDRLLTMETEESARQKIEEITRRLEKTRQDLSLSPGDDPDETLEDFRSFRRMREKIQSLRDALRERFPSTGDGPLPPIPAELLAIRDEMEDFRREFPSIEGMPGQDKILAEFSEMLILRGRIQEQQSLLTHHVENSPFLPILEKARQREGEIMEILSPILKATGTGPQDVEAAQARYHHLKSQAAEIEEELKGFQNISSLETQINQLLAQGALMEKSRRDTFDKMPSLKALFELDPAQADLKLRDLAQKIKDLEKNLAEKNDRRNYCRVRVEEFSQPREELCRLEEMMDEIRDKIERLEIQRDGCKIAVDALQDSVAQFQEYHLKELQEEISRIFTFITGDRYAKVSLDAGFEIHIEDSSNREVQKEAISSGTRDQLFFAVRLALARSLSDSVTPIPFLLDDPFGSFDEQRLKLSRKILDKIAAEHQVILFSHSQDYSGWGNMVSNLNPT